MVAVFTEANLSGMTNEQVAVSKVVQKTYIDVNEAGTEAAAATGCKLLFISFHSIFSAEVGIIITESIYSVLY